MSLFSLVALLVSDADAVFVAVARRDELKKARKARDQLSRKIAGDVIKGSDVVLSTTFGGTEKALDVRSLALILFQTI